MNLLLRDMLIVRGVSSSACLNKDPRISRVLYVDIRNTVRGQNVAPVVRWMALAVSGNLYNQQSLERCTLVDHQ